MLVGLCVAISVFGALFFVQGIFAQIAFALFLIGLISRLQRRLVGLMPPVVTRVITVAIEIAALAIVAFLSFNVIQNIFGSPIEPWITGTPAAVFSILILAASFSFFLWDISDDFIGVPVLIIALTICQRFPGSRCAAKLLSGRDLCPA